MNNFFKLIRKPLYDTVDKICDARFLVIAFKFVPNDNIKE